jgi:hypothetical protein
MHRPTFREALTWLELHGGRPGVVEHWRSSVAAAHVPGDAPAISREESPGRRRRRRRRRRRGRPPGGPPEQV